MPLNDIDRKIQRLERLLEVSRFLGTSLDLDSLLESVVNASTELSDSQSAAVLMFETETKLLKFVAATGADKEALKRIRLPLENSIVGTVYTKGWSMIIQDAREDARVSRELRKAVIGTIYSLMAVPMIFRGETIGVIEVINKRGRVNYTEEDVTILETLAAQSAVAVLSSVMIDEMKSAYEELEESEKKKNDFIAIASHELRTPLGLILGHAATLNDICREPQYKEQLEVLVRSADRLKRIVEDFSNVASFQAGNTKVSQKMVDIKLLVNEVVASFQAQALKKQIQLTRKLPHANIQVSGDREKLGLVISNLIENAVTYTNENGHVLVTAGRLAGYVKVSIMDDGIGIPAKDIPHIFDRFYQVEGHLTRHHGGMGLGLAVAKAMIELHNGQIWVESIEGKGSNFSYLLPLRDEEATHPNKIPAFEPGSI